MTEDDILRFESGADERRKNVDEIVAEYLDRLNAGEGLDPLDVFARHPDVGDQVLRELYTFVDIGQETPVNEPLGTLGDYTLRRQIGRGGMGVVYEAWQNSMDRQVALKVLPVGVAADEKAFQRFMREARTAGRLDHPNVVHVHGLGIEEQTPYYAMEFVEGETLARILAKLTEAEAETETVFGHKDSAAYFDKLVRAFADVAEGLQHAHSKGVVHRDIKPSNLILDTEGRLRILDFGLAHLEGQESLTVSGDVVGTPLYMSPEQARRRKIPIDHRTDLYSLGATMYETLTGRPPLRGKDHADTLSQIIERDPPDPRRLNARVPKDLETIVLKCLRKDPADRYGTAEALAQDLRRLARGDPIEARPQPAWERLALRLRRQRTKFAVAAMFLVLVGVVGWMAYTRERAEKRIEAVTEEAQQAKHEAQQINYEIAVREVRKKIYAGQYNLQVVEGELEGLFFRFSGRSLARMAPEEIKALWKARKAHPVEEAARELSVIAAVVRKPDAHYHLAKAYVLLDREEEAKTELRKALAYDADFVPARVLQSQLSGIDEHTPDFGAIWSRYEQAADWRSAWLEAHESVRQNDWARVADAYGKLIALREHGSEPYIGSAIEAHVGRGLAFLELQDYFRAQRDFGAACTLAPGFALGALLLGKAHYLDDEKDEAIEIFTELFDRVGPDEKNEVALWIAGVYYSLKDYEKGLQWAEKLGEKVPIKERLRSYFLLRAGEIERAIEAGREAIRRNEEDAVAHLVLASALSTDLGRRRGLDRQGTLVEFFRVAKMAVKLDSENASAQRLLAQAEAERNNFIRRQVVNTLLKTRGLSWVVPFLWALSGTQAASVDSSTYFGGERDDYFYRDVKIHPSGDIIAIGQSNSPDLPDACDAPNGSFLGLVVRFDPSLTKLVSATCFGGTGEDLPLRFDFAPDGTVVVVGYTESDDFPVTDETIHSGDRDAFVARIDTSPDIPRKERLLYASLLGGQNEDSFVDVDVDANGVVTAAGYTGSPELLELFPVTEDGFQEAFGGGLFDAFLIRLQPDGDDYEMVYSTFVGGTGHDAHPEARFARPIHASMVVDEKGLVTMTGSTMSRDFPVTDGAYKTTHNGGRDVYIFQINPDPELPPDEQRRYSTFLGGTSNENPLGVAFLDDAGTLVVAGITASRNFPVTPGVDQGTFGGPPIDTFVSIIRPDLKLPKEAQLLHSTYLGGPGWDDLLGMTVGAGGRIYLTGLADRDVAELDLDFPVTPDALQAEPRGAHNAFLSVFEADLKLVYSTLLGGTDSRWETGTAVTLTETGDVIVAGYTDACDFPMNPQAPAFQPDCAGGLDGFLIRLKLDPPAAELEFRRGDCNLDGNVNLSDATCALNWLFTGEAKPGCIAALNTNGDDDVNITDPVYLLSFLFGGGPAPVEPFPDCGAGDLAGLGCETGCQ